MSAKETGFVSCVVYVHNNEKELEHFLETVYPVFERQFSRYEFLFVDDDSSDKSADKVHAFFTAKGSCAVTVVSMGHYHGTEMAMAAGTDLAIGDFIYEFDSVRTDYPPELIVDVFRKMLEGYDIVGAHPSRSGNWKSSVFYKVFNHFSRPITIYKRSVSVFCQDVCLTGLMRPARQGYTGKRYMPRPD